VTKKYGVLPDWSPNGRTILFRSSDGFSVVAAKGGKAKLIHKDDGDMGASWSPDGKRIAFVHGSDPSVDETFSSTLYTMSPDGSGVRRLLGHACNPRTPDWSPSGRFLVFACDRGIYYMRSTGGSLDRLILGSFGDAPVSVSASPDARLLAFAESDIEICTVNGNDDPKILPGTMYNDIATIDVAWSPDSKRIAFSVVGSFGEDGLYVIDRNGSHRRRLARF
jgi:Tol biopolymer transport system component